MKFQTFGLIFLLAVLGEFVQTPDAYKSIRPYKYYRPRPRGHKPRWHEFSRPSRYRHFKKRPPRPHYRRPHSAWNGLRYATDHINDEQPYTIEIELSKRQHGYSWINDLHNRNSIREVAHDFYTDDDYLEEDEDFEERVMRTGKKKVRIKVIKGVKPKLRIKISRNDNPTEFVDSATSPIGGGISLQRDTSLSLKKLGQIVDGEWMTEYPVPSYPEALRGFHVIS